MANSPHHISILDVGHGNCTVLSGPQGVFIFDAGPGSALLEFLLHENITRIDLLFISHADKDHIEGIISLLESDLIKIDYIKVNTDSAKKSILWDDLTYELGRANRKGEIVFEIGLTTNDCGKYHNGFIEVEVLAPSPYIAAKGPGSLDHQGRKLSSNSNSAVIRLSKDKMPIALLLGDIDKIGLENMQDENKDMSAPIIVFPHHGGKPGQGDVKEFTNYIYSLTKASTIIFSVGRGRFKNPKPEIIETLLELNEDITIFCTQISETCAQKLPKVSPVHLPDNYARGKESNSSCAGTVVISIDSDKMMILPSKVDHRKFVMENIPQALCFNE